jgi:putative transposase
MMPAFKRSLKIKELLKPTRCQAIFLPTYSPDLDKIEQFWARLKKPVSKLVKECKTLFDAVRAAFLDLS